MSLRDTYIRITKVAAIIANATKAELYLNTDGITVKTAVYVNKNQKVEDSDIQSEISLALETDEKKVGKLKVYFSGTGQPELNKELNELVPLLACTIERAQLIDSLQDAIDIRDRFISFSAHEIRTPLTAINGYAQLLKGRIKSDKTSEYKWINELYSETVKITQLIKALLNRELMRTIHFQYSIVQFHLLELLHNVVQQINTEFPQTRIEIRDKLSGKEDITTGDYNKLFQVITELLKNIIESSIQSDLIHITVSKNTQKYIISFSGKGLSMNKKRIGAFFQKTLIPEESKNINIGLLLMKHVIAHHNGSLEIIPDSQSGVKIDLTLPLPVPELI